MNEKKSETKATETKAIAAAPKEQRPSIGRVVIIRRRDGKPISGEAMEAPAIVQRALGGPPGHDGIDCVCFPSGDSPRNLVCVRPNIHDCADDATRDGLTFSWSWPARETINFNGPALQA